MLLPNRPNLEREKKKPNIFTKAQNQQKTIKKDGGGASSRSPRIIPFPSMLLVSFSCSTRAVTSIPYSPSVLKDGPLRSFVVLASHCLVKPIVLPSPTHPFRL
ncbi:hypothetical protein Droror1_Dr00026867 [Drosera rotundifolia]